MLDWFGRDNTSYQHNTGMVAPIINLEQ